MKKIMMCLCGALFVAMSLFGDTETVDGIKWAYTVTDGKAEIGKGQRSAAIPLSTTGAITVPSELGGCPVTSIGWYAFYECCYLTSVTIPASVTSIGDSAFCCCESLKSVIWRGNAPTVVPYEGEEEIYGVFEDSNEELVNYVPMTATGWGETWQERQVVTYDSSITYTVTFDLGEHGSLVNGALEQTVGNMDSAIAPEFEVEDGWFFVGWNVDFSCVTSNLVVTAIWREYVDMPEGWTYLDDNSDGVLYYSDGSLLISKIGHGNTRGVQFTTTGRGILSFKWKVSSEEEYDCAEVRLDGEGVRSISGIVEEWQEASVVIEDGGCHVWTLCYTKDDSVDAGENSAWFKDVTWTPKTSNWDYELAEGEQGVVIVGHSDSISGELAIPTTVDGFTVVGIGDYAFAWCDGLTSVTIPVSVTRIGIDAFVECNNLSSVIFEGNENDVEINDNAFGGTPYEASMPFELIVENGVLMKFKGACPAEFAIPADTRVIENRVFYPSRHTSARNITDVIFNEGLETIGISAFYNCYNLREILLPSTVTTLANGAFGACHSVTNIVLNEGLQTICSGALGSGTVKDEITLPITVQNISLDAFIGTDGTIKVHAPWSLYGILESGEVYQRVWSTEYYVVTTTVDVVFYGDKPNFYTVSFVVNGGDGLGSNEIAVMENRTLGTLPVPSRSQYKFLGWFTEADGGEQITGRTIVTGNMTLYAHWEERILPANDNFADATVVSGVSGSIAGTTTDSTREEVDLLPDNYDENYTSTVWYKWTAPTDGTYVFSVADPDYYSERSFSIVVTTGYDQNNGWSYYTPTKDCVSIRAVSGTEYWIEIASYFEEGYDEAIDFILSWGEGAANDEYQNAQLLESATSGSVDGTLLGATIASNDCIWHYGYAKRTVWYKWIAPTTGAVTFSATANNGISGLLYLVATHGYDTETGRWDDCGYDYGRTVTFSVVEGTTYYVSLCTWNYVVNGFSLTWKCEEPPVNDNFVNASEIDGEFGRVAGSNAWASVEEGELLVSYAETTASVWWKWVAPQNGIFMFKTLGSDFDTVIGVYTGSVVDELSKIKENDDFNDYDYTSAVDIEVVAGTTYYIAVGGYGRNRGNIVLSWTSGREIVPEIDDGSSADELSAVIDAVGFVDADAIETAIDGNVENYNAFVEWAQNTDDGQVAVIKSPRAALSYLLGTSELIANDIASEDIHIESFSKANDEEDSNKVGFDFVVALDDIAVGSGKINEIVLKENLKKVVGVEGSSDLSSGSFSSDNIDIEFGTPVDGKLNFTVKPLANAPNQYFMKVKVNQ